MGSVLWHISEVFMQLFSVILFVNKHDSLKMQHFSMRIEENEFNESFRTFSCEKIKYGGIFSCYVIYC